MTSAFEALKTKSAQVSSGKTGKTSAFDALKEKSGSSQVSENLPEEGGGVGGFVKSLISAPLTTIARPIQATAEVLGASSESVNKVTKKLSGGFVAPVPENFSDVKKDIGRAVQTVGFGAAGPVSAGAALGLGSSLEQGNDLISAQTAFQTVLGAVGGKVLDLIGKPILDATGKVVGKITPQIIKDTASKGTKAITDFAATHQLLPKETSKTITNIAEKAENYANKPFQVAGNTVKKAFTTAPEKTIQGRTNTLQRLEDNNAVMRRYANKQKTRGFDPKSDANVGDLLVDSVDNTGTIRTTGKGGAVEKYQEFLKSDGREKVVSNILDQEGKKVSLKSVEADIKRAINTSGLEADALENAHGKIDTVMSGLRRRADAEGNITLSKINDAKISKYQTIDYLNEGSKQADKSIARTFKNIVEKNTESADVKAINNELAKHYANIGYLERLDGRKVEGGRLGKYFAKTLGGIAGSHFGPLGTIAGAELAGAVKGATMQSTFGKKLGLELSDSPLMKKAIEQAKFTKLRVKSLPSDYTNELPTIPFGKKIKPKKNFLPTIR